MRESAAAGYASEGTSRLGERRLPVSLRHRGRVRRVPSVLVAVGALLASVAIAPPGSAAPVPGIIRTVVGSGDCLPNPADSYFPDCVQYGGDGGAGTAALLNGPTSVAVKGDIVYFADRANHRVRVWNKGSATTKVHGVNVAPNRIETVAGNPACGKWDDDDDITTPEVCDYYFVGDFSGDGGPATSAKLNEPNGITVASNGDLYIADTQNHRVRKVLAASGATDGPAKARISTVAGTTRGFSGDNGTATSAQLDLPYGLAFDSATPPNLYIADFSNHRVRKVTGTTITTYAGTSTRGFSGDNGPATSAALYTPIGVEVDGSGNLYISDQGNHNIRKVSTSGTITTVVGCSASPCTQDYGVSGDGAPATLAKLYLPFSVEVVSSGFYISDMGNHRARFVNTSNAPVTVLGVPVQAGHIATVAGSGVKNAGLTGKIVGQDGDFFGDGGPATLARLHTPRGVAVDSGGNLYIADDGNQRIRKVDAA